MKRRFLSFSYLSAILLGLSFAVSHKADAQIITTIAGTGSAGFSGDGGAATAARIDGATVITFDSSGNLYFPDYDNNRIRKISTSGIILTVVGNGSSGYASDGGAATAATLNRPSFVTIHNGEMFIADYYNHRIRKVNTSGVITTIAGNGSVGFSGDGGAASAAKLYYPTSVAFDNSGNMLIVDEANDRVRRVNSSGVISTFAGGGYNRASGIPATTSVLSRPGGITVDAAGNVYIADVENARICKVNSSGTLTVYAGTGATGYSGDGGAATAAMLNHPLRLSIDSFGTLYFGDQRNDRARKITASGIISTIAGTGVAGYSGDGGAATTAKLYGPQGVCKDRWGNIYITDADNRRIRKISACTVSVSNIAGVSSVFLRRTGVLSNATLGGTWSSSNPTIVSVSNTGIVYGGSIGTATISYIVSTGCGSDISTKSITVINKHPVFLSSNYTVSFCPGMSGYNLNTFLRVNDADSGQTLTWRIGTGPSHGTATVAHTATSTGGLVTPTGLSYMPSAGYSGTDVFTVKVSDGYDSSIITINITVYPAPAVASISGANTVCEGANITLTSSISGGTWSTENNLASVTSSGVVTGRVGGYNNTIYYTMSSAQCGLRTVGYPISIHKIPVVYPIIGNSSVAVGNTITLVDYTASGTWSSSSPSVISVSSAGVARGIATGSANVLYTVSNECGSTTVSKTMTVTGHKIEASGNAISSYETSLTLFPNPNTGNFQLNVSFNADIQVPVLITNIAGQKVYETSIASNQPTEINPGLAPGMYFIAAFIDGKQVTTKIVVQ